MKMMIILLNNLKVQSMWSLRERGNHLQNLLLQLPRKMMRDFFFCLLPLVLQINIARAVTKLCSIKVIYQDWDWTKSTRKNLSFDYSRFQTALFSLVATAPINLPPPTPIPLNWKTNQPVWIEQWPLKQNKKKFEALHELVNEQLNNRYIIESFSPWNSPVYIIQKKSG